MKEIKIGIHIPLLPEIIDPKGGPKPWWDVNTITGYQHPVAKYLFWKYPEPQYWWYCIYNSYDWVTEEHYHAS